MRPEAKFHSRNASVFKHSEELRAFIYSDYSVAPHIHDFYEINIILGGKGTHVIESSTFEVRAGDVFVIPPMIVHAYFDTEKLDVYHFILRKEFIDRNKTEAKTIPGFMQFFEIEPFLRRHFSDAMFLRLSSGRLASIREELKFIDDSSAFSDTVLAPMKHHAAWKLIYTLSYMLYEQLNRKSVQPSDKYERAVLETLEYIHQHYSEKITVDTLCRLTFLSRSTFLRSFSTICGCTPAQYISRYRSRLACELLASGEYSKTEIAVMCGFYDLSHMERVIRTQR